MWNLICMLSSVRAFQTFTAVHVCLCVCLCLGWFGTFTAVPSLHRTTSCMTKGSLTLPLIRFLTKFELKPSKEFILTPESFLFVYKISCRLPKCLKRVPRSSLKSFYTKQQTEAIGNKKNSIWEGLCLTPRFTSRSNSKYQKLSSWTWNIYPGARSSKYFQ